MGGPGTAEHTGIICRGGGVDHSNSHSGAPSRDTADTAVPDSAAFGVTGGGTCRATRAVDILAIGVVIVDAAGRIDYRNPAATGILGGFVNADVGVAGRPSLHQHPLYSAHGEPLTPGERPVARARRSGRSTDTVIGFDRANGQRVWLHVTCALLDPSDPDSSAVVLSFTDISESHATSAQLAYRATHDDLTGLPNRAHTIAALAHHLRARHRRDALVVMFIDLDNLKTINDTCGHSVGDIVIRTCAERLRRALPATATLGRFGGDEFVALHLDGLDTLRTLTADLHTTLHAPITTTTTQVRPRASIGVVIVPPQDPRTTDNVLRDADRAMYEAKAHGGNHTRYFTPS